MKDLFIIHFSITLLSFFKAIAWDLNTIETVQFSCCAEYRSVKLPELVVPLANIGVLALQMLSFPFSTDFPWSKEVKPLQITLPYFQLAFEITPSIFTIQFWLTAMFTSLYCAMLIFDIHEDITDKIAALSIGLLDGSEEIKEDKEDTGRASFHEIIQRSNSFVSNPVSQTKTIAMVPLGSSNGQGNPKRSRLEIIRDLSDLDKQDITYILNYGLSPVVEGILIRLYFAYGKFQRPPESASAVLGMISRTFQTQNLKQARNENDTTISDLSSEGLLFPQLDDSAIYMLLRDFSLLGASGVTYFDIKDAMQEKVKHELNEFKVSLNFIVVVFLQSLAPVCFSSLSKKKKKK